MKRYILLIALTLSLPQLMSCKKFLEEQSQTDVIPKDINTLNELLLGEAYYGGANIALSTINDDVDQQKYVFSKLIFDRYTWQPELISDKNVSDYVTGLWTTYYKRIQICNVVLEYSEKVTGSESDKNYVKGQAYLLRAFCYFNLVNYFGKPYLDKFSNPGQDPGVPLILKSGVSLEGKPRNTVKITYQQILKDLDQGIELMDKGKKNNGLYRINATAGHLLSSRVNLYMGNWSRAIDAANAVLLTKQELVDLNTWGTPDRNNKPVIASSNPEIIWGFGSVSELVPSHHPEQNSYGLSSSLINLFGEGDLRNGIYFKEGKSTKRKVITAYNIKADICHIFRVSEAMLNRAEAYAQLNKLGQTENAQLALNDLNTLRKKRLLASTYQDLANLSADNLLQECYQERRRELFDEENHRWFDLRRQGMPSITHRFFESEVQVLTYKLEDHDPAYTFYIPKAAIDLNPSLIPNPEISIRLGY